MKHLLNCIWALRSAAHVHCQNSLQNRKATSRVPAGDKIWSLLTTSLCLGRVLVGAVAFAQTPSVCLYCIVSWYRSGLYELWSWIQIKNLNYAAFLKAWPFMSVLVISTELRNWCLDRGFRQLSCKRHKRETHLSAARHVPVCEKS